MASTAPAGDVTLDVPLRDAKVQHYAFQLHGGDDVSDADAERLWRQLADAVECVGHAGRTGDDALDAALRRGAERTAANHAAVETPIPFFSRGRYSSPHHDPTYRLQVDPAASDGVIAAGQVYAMRVHDYYALDTTLYGGSAVWPSQLGAFNRNGCLLPERFGRDNSSFLGQTLVLSGRIDDGVPSDDISAYASACARHLLGAAFATHHVACVGAGTLFGGPFVAFDNYAQRPGERCHLLVWLARSDATADAERSGAYYDPLLLLLAARAKIVAGRVPARESFEGALRSQHTVEDVLAKFCALDFRAEERAGRIPLLKEWMTTLPASFIAYVGALRRLENYRTMSAVNARNYRAKLRDLRARSRALGVDLAPLTTFLSGEAAQQLRQIDADIAYLRPGNEFHQQATAAIRAFASLDAREHELEQAQLLRQREDEAGRRERRTERLIAGAGIAIATGAIVAAVIPHPLGATSPPITAQDWLRTSLEIALLLGITAIVGIVVYWLLRPSSAEASSRVPTRPA
jgi:hypothetical protein